MEASSYFFLGCMLQVEGFSAFSRQLFTFFSHIPAVVQSF